MIRYNTVKTETILSFNSYDKIVFCDLLKNNLDNRRLGSVHLTEKTEDFRSQQNHIFAGAKCADDKSIKAVAVKRGREFLISGARQRDLKGRGVLCGRREAQRAAVEFDDLLRQRQAEAVTVRGSGGIRLIELFKDMRRVRL